IEVVCDREQIQQAFLAILDNAIGAMSKGGSITVKTSCDTDKKKVRIDFKDSGPGISPTDLPHIFEPFYTTKKEGKGLGLGLSVCYGIIERHNGKIEVNSAVGEGSTFSIQLPAHCGGNKPGGSYFKI
ncbi:MAG: ATP-binding protein, partial [candidate division Zixibacteria bacterium]|nr:ATP-binding protein [candidate division Zixibacteria bacterium]